MAKPNKCIIKVWPRYQAISPPFLSVQINCFCKNAEQMGWFRCGSKGSEWVFCSRGGVSDWHYDYQQKEQMENRPKGEVRIGRLELFMGPLIILFPLCMLPELCYRFLSTAEHRGIWLHTHTHTQIQPQHFLTMDVNPAVWFL